MSQLSNNKYISIICYISIDRKESMTTLNLTKDPVLVLLLNNMIRGAAKISLHDNALNQRVNELRFVRKNPTAVQYEPLSNSVSRLGEILAGYQLGNVKNKDGDVMTQGNEVSALPAIIYNFKTKLDELKSHTEINQKHFSTAEIDEKVNEFVALADGE